MPLRLTIENIPSLPDGGPVSYTLSGKRGLDIGRDQYLDWVLPDPNRVVSGKHCEVRFRDGGYWLRDVSTNGTFVNRSERRLQEPHRLQHGDRVEIGHYIISVAIDGEEQGGAAAAADPEAFWNGAGGEAPPADPREFKPAKAPRPIHSVDVLDWIASVPEPTRDSYANAQPGMAGAAAPSSGGGEDVWGNSNAAATPPRMDRPAQPSASDGWGGGLPPPAPPPVPNSWQQPAQSPPPPDAWGEAPVQASPPAQPAAPPAPAPAMPPPLPPAAPPRTREPSVPPLEPAVAMPRAHPFGQTPPAAPASLPDRAPPRAASAGDSDVIRRFAAGVGLPESAIATRDPGELAEELGVLIRIVAGNLMQLLAARAESKGAMRSANQTLVQATDNNPLRFAPTAEDAIGIMFGRPTRSYLDARRALEQSFGDVKSHQVDSFAAIQHAIQQLVADLDPKEIEKAVDDGKKSGGLFSNRKVQLWDNYLLRWKLKAGRHESGLTGAFMQYFAEAYDKRKR